MRFFDCSENAYIVISFAYSRPSRPQRVQHQDSKRRKPAVHRDFA